MEAPVCTGVDSNAGNYPVLSDNPTREEQIAYMERVSGVSEPRTSGCVMCGECCEGFSVPDMAAKVYDYFELLEEEISAERVEISEQLESLEFNTGDPEVDAIAAELVGAVQHRNSSKTVKKWYRCRLLGEPQEIIDEHGITHTIRLCPLHGTPEQPALCRHHPVRPEARCPKCSVRFKSEDEEEREDKPVDQEEPSGFRDEP